MTSSNIESAHDLSCAEPVQPFDNNNAPANDALTELVDTPEKVFVSNVKLYLSMYDEINQKTKEVSLLRKQRQQLKDYIMHFMKNHNIDQCVSESGKLYIAKTKSSQPVNKDYIFSTLSSDIGVEMAERLVESLWSKREVVTKETLRRTKK